MSVSFPTSIDVLTNPQATDKVSVVNHAEQHSNANDAIEALEAKVGVDSSAVTTSHDYLLRHLPAQEQNWDIGSYNLRAESLTADALTSGRLVRAGTNGLLGDATVTESSGALGGITTLSMNNQLTNTLADGTAPFVITSATKVTNLNVDKVDGYDLDQGISTTDSPIFGNLTLTYGIQSGTAFITSGIRGGSLSITGHAGFNTVEIDGGTVDNITSLTVANNVDIGNFDLRALSLTADGLTSGRVPFITTNGQLTDNGNLLYNSSASTLTVTGTAKVSGLDLSAGETHVVMIDNTQTAVVFREGNNHYLKFDTSDGTSKIVIGADMEIGSIELPTNAGAVTLVNLPASTTAQTEESYGFQIGGTTILKVFAKTKNYALVDNESVGILTEEPHATLDVAGSMIVRGTRNGSLFIITETGKIGINQNPPAYLLDVNGSIRVSGIQTGSIYVTQEINAGSAIISVGVRSGSLSITGNTGLNTVDLAGKLTAGASEIEGSNFDIDGGDISSSTISGSLTWNAIQSFLQGITANTATILYGLSAGSLQIWGGNGNVDFNNNSVGFSLQTTTCTGGGAIDWRRSNKLKAILQGDSTFTFTAPPNPCNLLMMVVQDNVGSRLVSFPDNVNWASGGTAPTLTTTASGTDIISLFWDGSQYYAVPSLNFA